MQDFLKAGRDRVWIKICGTTTLEDAQCALDAGADALGFVFAPSPRRVSVAQAANITAHLRPDVKSYGVFVHPSFAEVVATVQEAGLSGIQLHAFSDPTLTKQLRAYFDANPGGRRVSIFQVLHYPASGQGFASALQTAAQDSAADGLLIDSRSGGVQGGTGLRFDWRKARRELLDIAPHVRLIVAGGLTPENVEEAVATLAPWGLDVVTGVEKEPGRKDLERVQTFIQRARASVSTPYSKA